MIPREIRQVGKISSSKLGRGQCFFCCCFIFVLFVIFFFQNKKKETKTKKAKNIFCVVTYLFLFFVTFFQKKILDLHWAWSVCQVILCITTCLKNSENSYWSLATVLDAKRILKNKNKLIFTKKFWKNFEVLILRKT